MDHFPQVCQMRMDLAAIYAEAVTFQTRAALALSDAARTATQAERDDLRKNLLTIREYSQAAMHAYEEHLLEHRCDSFPDRVNPDAAGAR